MGIPKYEILKVQMQTITVSLKIEDSRESQTSHRRSLSTTGDRVGTTRMNTVRFIIPENYLQVQHSQIWLQKQKFLKNEGVNKKDWKENQLTKWMLWDNKRIKILNQEKYWNCREIEWLIFFVSFTIEDMGNPSWVWLSRVGMRGRNKAAKANWVNNAGYSRK